MSRRKSSANLSQRPNAFSFFLSFFSPLVLNIQIFCNEKKTIIKVKLFKNLDVYLPSKPRKSLHFLYIFVLVNYFLILFFNQHPIEVKLCLDVLQRTTNALGVVLCKRSLQCLFNVLFKFPEVSSIFFISLQNNGVNSCFDFKVVNILCCINFLRGTCIIFFIKFR